jgi:hypothetical protein
MTETTLATMVRDGILIPVQVFGGHSDPSDPHGNSDAVTCPACDAPLEWGYGLCDRMSTHAPAGSDCNRAAFFLLRPSDAAMADPALRDAIRAVLKNPDEDLT